MFWSLFRALVMLTVGCFEHKGAPDIKKGSLEVTQSHSLYQKCQAFAQMWQMLFKSDFKIKLMLNTVFFPCKQNFAISVHRWSVTSQYQKPQRKNCTEFDKHTFVTAMTSLTHQGPRVFSSSPLCASVPDDSWCIRAVQYYQDIDYITWYTVHRILITVSSYRHKNVILGSQIKWFQNESSNSDFWQL